MELFKVSRRRQFAKKLKLILLISLFLIYLCKHLTFNPTIMKKFLSIILLFALNLGCTEKDGTIKDPMDIFADKLGTTLADGVKKKDIKRIENNDIRDVAMSLYKDKYSTYCRVAKYNAILSTQELGRQLHTGNGYSNYEGITGIYIEEGEQMIIVDNLAEDKIIKLLIPDWNRRAHKGIEPSKDPNGWGLKKDMYAISNGLNKVNIKRSGLAYISYYSDKPETENEISVHFLNDKVNGYFDITKHTNKDWKILLNSAVAPIMDARGRHCQIAYPVSALKKHTKGEGVELISNYDSLIRRQHRLIGLEKYNKIPKNRILARVNYNYYMFRDWDGVAYMGGYGYSYAMGMVADPDVVITGDPSWGFSHEIGHVHQLRPDLNWGGLGEVSNNIATMYVTKSFGMKSRLSEDKIYEKARKTILDKRVSFLKSDDVMCRLVPFWQLELYFSQNGYKDFYPDLYEELRKNADARESLVDSKKGSKMYTNSYFQLNFVKTACKVAKLDLTDFFDKWGFFYVGNFDNKDYGGSYSYSMTATEVAKIKKEIKNMNLPRPTEDITTYED